MTTLPAKIKIAISLRINYLEVKTLTQKHKLENSGEKKGIHKFLKTSTNNHHKRKDPSICLGAIIHRQRKYTIVTTPRAKHHVAQYRRSRSGRPRFDLRRNQELKLSGRDRNSHQLGVPDLVPGVGRHRIRCRIAEPRRGLDEIKPYTRNRAGEFLVVCFRRSRVPLVLYDSPFVFFPLRKRVFHSNPCQVT